MRVFFLSDLHLEDGDADASERLSLFLRQLPQQNDILILGGDIFDLFVGNKQVFRRRHAKSIESIREVSSRGVIFHYLEGNHDFHFSGVFADCSNICVHRGDFELSANGRRIWVSHGDLIDPEDTGYRLLRAVTKNAAFKLFGPNLGADRTARIASTVSNYASALYEQSRRTGQ